MWHSAQYRGEELIVLGHDPRRNDCMLVKLSALPMNEQQELRRIAASRSGQESSHLIPILRRMQSPNGSDWFTYLAQKMQQRNSPVFTLPIKEIQDSLDDDQKAIFKGYGKGRRNSALDRDDMSREFTGEQPVDDDLADLRDRSSIRHAESASIDSSSLGNKFDLLIETVSDENHRTQELLTRVLLALAGPEEPAKRTASKPKRAPRPSARKRTADKHIQTEVEAYEAQ